MAAAYRVVDRTHAPLTSPLEDPNPSIAHLKIHWPSSFQRLQETTLQSDFCSGTDYSNVKPHSPQSGTDNLLVLNVYRTTDHSPSWGLGPSPLSPLYICYPALHPADRSLPKPPKSASLPNAGAIFSPNKNRGHLAHTSRPNLIQFFLDRKDFSTHASSTMVCVRFLEEFVEWRLIPNPDPPAEAKVNKASVNQGDCVDGCALNTPNTKSLLGRIALKKAASVNALRNVFQQPTSASASTSPFMGNIRHPSGSFATSYATNLPKDVPAAHIFLTPSIRPVDQRRSKPLANLFTSFVSELGVGSSPMYTTLEEVGGQAGIELFFSPGSENKTYWWVWENTSWRVVFNPTDKTSTKNGKTVSEQKIGERNTPGEVSPSGRPVARNDPVGEANERSLNPEPSSPSLSSQFKRPYPDAKQSKNPSPITRGTVKLYAANQIESVASVELSTGQMWIVKSVLLNTIDIVVAVMFAVVNLERAIKDEHMSARGEY